MAKTNEQLLREALEKTTDLITSMITLQDDTEAFDLISSVAEDIEMLARRILAQTTPDTNACAHIPDWSSTYTNYDCDEEYLDVFCLKCGTSGCIGTTRTITEGIGWE